MSTSVVRTVYKSQSIWTAKNAKLQGTANGQSSTWCLHMLTRTWRNDKQISQQMCYYKMWIKTSGTGGKTKDTETMLFLVMQSLLVDFIRLVLGEPPGRPSL